MVAVGTGLTSGSTDVEASVRNSVLGGALAKHREWLERNRWIAGVVEMVDTALSQSAGRKPVWVRIPSPARSTRYGGTRIDHAGVER